jgi:predicted dehydrogenase
MTPYSKNRHVYNWHWFWDTGNGDIGNQGVHEIDIARWGIKDATLPTKVWSMGGRLLPDGPDQGQTPNIQLAVLEFGETLLVFEVRGLVGKHKDFQPQVSNEYYTTEGVIKGGKFYEKGSDQGESLEVADVPKLIPGGAFGSFLTAVRERQLVNNCNAEVAHFSSALCHLSNISYRLGTPATFEAAKAKAGTQAQVTEALDRINANCTAVGALPKDGNFVVGRSLAFDPAKEKFVGDDEANQLLTRPYRAPFVVPEKV